MKRKTLLLINSSQVLLDLTRKILERAGYSVRCAVGSTVAKELLMDYTPDGIILENDLPDGSGLDYCRELRKECAVPIMFLSKSKDDQQPAMQAGANYFLKKPFDYEVMKDQLNLMLNDDTIVSTFASDDETAEDYPEQSPPIGPAQAAEVIRRRRAPGVKRGILAIASVICIAVVLAGFVLINKWLSNPADYYRILDDQTPLAEFPLQGIDGNAKKFTGEAKVIVIPVVNDVTILAGAKEAKIHLLNPADNACYLAFKIVIEGSEDVLYSSNLIEPGMYLEEITLSRGLARGEYRATMEIRAYSLEDIIETNNFSVKFHIKVN